MFLLGLQRWRGPPGGLLAFSPVQSDGAEVEDAGGAAEHVSRQPDLAGDGAEYPATQHRVGNIQG